MNRDELHGTANRYGIGELPDTGVDNGSLWPTQLAKLAAWAVVAVVMLAPLYL